MQPEGEEGKGGGHSHQDLEPEAQIRRGPQAEEFNGRAAHSLQSCGLGPAQQGDVNPNPTASTHWHTHHTDTHTWGIDTTYNKDPPCLWPESFIQVPSQVTGVQAEGWGKAALCLGLDLVQRL